MKSLDVPIYWKRRRFTADASLFLLPPINQSMHPSKSGLSSIYGVIVPNTSLEMRGLKWHLHFDCRGTDSELYFFRINSKIDNFASLLFVCWFFFFVWHSFIRLLWVYLALRQSCVMPHASRLLDDDAKFLVFNARRDGESRSDNEKYSSALQRPHREGGPSRVADTE